MSKAKWAVNIKGRKPRQCEISVLRDDNKHGKDSWGWFDTETKLLIGEAGHSWGYTPFIYKRLVAFAYQIADELNAREALAVAVRQEQSL